ncbi:MAG: hypothetical protein Fur009_7040 [Candidatus Microgenomates bacterium]
MYNKFSMKANIHPKFYEDATVVCACGNTFTTGSTKQSITVEVCHKCHPFYTGEQRFLDTKGRVDTFQKKQQYAQKYQQTKSKKTEKQKQEKQTKSLRELLME